MTKYNYEKLKEYENFEFLNQGGNGDIYKVKDKYDNVFVIKFLQKSLLSNKNKKNRFTYEINFLLNNKENENILPIYEHYSFNIETNEFWYTMPLALPLNKIKLPQYKKFERQLNAIKLFATGLVNLHNKKIFHRDIKPDNMFVYKNKCVFGDFGLVAFPSKPNITKTSDRIGNNLTIAPEVRYIKKDAYKNLDWEKVDVYAFAKTIWMILTESKNSFDGSYNDDDPIISLDTYYPDEYLVDLKILLKSATNNTPQNRPTSKEFLDTIELFIERHNNHTTSNLIEWKYIANKIYGGNVPSKAIYEDKQKIIDFLNSISKKGLNHTFFEDGGGMAMHGAKNAQEKGCIEIDFGYTMIGKPIRLIYHNIDESNCAFNYVELQFDSIAPVFGSHNKLVEDIYISKKGKYIKFEYGEEGYDFTTGESLEKGCRKAVRRLKGKIVIFPTRSIYNQINGTYDGRHKNFKSDGFREYIKKMKDDFYSLHNNDFWEKYEVFKKINKIK